MMAEMFKHEVTVEPEGGFAFSFPIDMLRYDCCYPRNGEDSARIISATSPILNRRGKVRVSVMTVANKGWKPTVARWRSFGWRVVEHRVQAL